MPGDNVLLYAQAPTGQPIELQADAAGNLKINTAAGAGSNVNVTQFGSNNVVTGTGASGVGIPRVTVSNDSVVGANVTQFGGNNVVTGVGASGVGVPRVTVSNDSTVGSNSPTAAAVPANAFYVGGDAATALPTANTGGQLTGHMVDKYGRSIVMGGLRELKAPAHTTITSSTVETTIIAAIAGVFIDVYMLLINNSSATACTVTIRDATAGTIRFVITVPAGDVRGFTLPQDSAHPQSAVNNNWTATCGTSVASIDITALYVQNK